MPDIRMPADSTPHPVWDSPSLCTDNGTDIVHAEVPTMFVANDHVLFLSRVRCDDHEATYPHEVRLQNEDGETVAHLSREDIPKLCALLLSLSRDD